MNTGREHNSGEDYAKDLIAEIALGELQQTSDKKTDPVLLDHWYREILTTSNRAWDEYLAGKRASYRLDEEEFQASLDRATSNFLGTILSDLLDKDMLKLSVSDSGEILYGLSNQGRSYLDKLG